MGGWWWYRSEIGKVKVFSPSDKVTKKSGRIANCFFFSYTRKRYIQKEKRWYCMGNWIEAEHKPNTRRLGNIVTWCCLYRIGWKKQLLRYSKDERNCWGFFFAPKAISFMCRGRLAVERQALNRYSNFSQSEKIDARDIRHQMVCHFLPRQNIMLTTCYWFLNLVKNEHSVFLYNCSCHPPNCLQYFAMRWNAPVIKFTHWTT